MLDACRFLAIIGVIWVHTPESELLHGSYSLGFFGVPFFIMCAVLLTMQGVRRSPSRSLVEYTGTRFRRLYIPFLIWTALYLLMIDAKHRFLSGQPPVKFSFWLLIAGSTHHLWFLPYILIVGTAALGICKVSIARPRSTVPMAAVSFVIGVALIFLPDVQWNGLQFLGGTYKLVAWSRIRLPSAFIGVAFALIYPRIPAAFWRRSLIGVVGALITVGAMGLMWRTPWVPPLWRPVGGFGWLMLALMPWDGPVVRFLSRWGRCVFGIYLVHVVPIEGLQAFAAWCGLVALAWLDIIVLLASVVISSLLSKILTGRGWLACLFPG